MIVSRYSIWDDRVRDKSKPVRRALEEMYGKIAEAQRNEDIETLRATRLLAGFNDMRSASERIR